MESNEKEKPLTRKELRELEKKALSGQTFLHSAQCEAQSRLVFDSFFKDHSCNDLDGKFVKVTPEAVIDTFKQKTAPTKTLRTILIKILGGMIVAIKTQMAVKKFFKGLVPNFLIKK